MSGAEGLSAGFAGIVVLHKIMQLLLEVDASKSYIRQTELHVSAINTGIESIERTMAGYRLDREHQKYYRAKMAECYEQFLIVEGLMQGLRNYHDNHNTFFARLRFIFRLKSKLLQALEVIRTLVENLRVWQASEAMHCFKFDPNTLHADHNPSARVYLSGLENAVVQDLGLDSGEMESFLEEFKRAKKEMEAFDNAALRIERL